MDALLERLSSGQVVAVISIVCGSLAFVVLVLAITKYQFQSLADETALRRERQQAEFALRETLVARRAATGDAVPLEELLALGMSEPAPDNLDAQLATLFGMLETSPETIEQTLRQAMATSPARKKIIVEVLDGLLNNEAPPDAILAAVRPLCGVAKEMPSEHAA